MRWTISVFTGDRSTLLFAGQCADRAEAETLASTARAQRADVVIFLRSPTGAVTEWE